LDLPLGTQDANLLDTDTSDEDQDAMLPGIADEDVEAAVSANILATPLRTKADYRKRASEIYQEYATQYRRRFKWLRPTLFNAHLKKDLLQDAQNLLHILTECGSWDASEDAKLAAL